MQIPFLFVLVLVPSLALGDEHADDVAAITDVLNEFYRRLGDEDMHGKNYTRFFDDDAILNIAGKTARGHAEIEKEESETLDKNYRIDSYEIGTIVVNGMGASASVTGKDFIDGQDREFEDCIILKKNEGSGEWKFEAVIVYVDIVLPEDSLQ